MYSEIKYEGKQLKAGCIWIVGIECVNDLFIDLSDHPLCPLSGISLFFLFLRTKYHSTLRVGEWFRLGQTALSINDLHHSMLWMQQALRQLNEGSIALSPRFKSWTISEISASGLDLYRAVDFTNQLLSFGNTLGS